MSGLNLTESMEALVEEEIEELESPVRDCMGEIYNPDLLMAETDQLLLPQTEQMLEAPVSVISDCLSLVPDDALLEEWLLQEYVVVAPGSEETQTTNNEPLIDTSTDTLGHPVENEAQCHTMETGNYLGRALWVRSTGDQHK